MENSLEISDKEMPLLIVKDQKVKDALAKANLT